MQKILSIIFELYAQIDQGNLQERSFLNGSKLATKKKSLLTFFANNPINDVITHWFLWGPPSEKSSLVFFPDWVVQLFT